jgi:hypothetical protein
MFFVWSKEAINEYALSYGDVVSMHGERPKKGANMKGVRFAWKYLSSMANHAQYDWFLLVELDMFTRISRVRQLLALYESMFGSIISEPSIIIVKNVFVFSRGYVQQHKLKGFDSCAPYCTGDCSCAQDEYYPKMARDRNSTLANFYGARLAESNAKCEGLLIDMQPGFPNANGMKYKWQPGLEPSKQKAFIIAYAQHASNRTPNDCANFPEQNVAFIHHIRGASVHRLAGCLLGF